MKDIDLAYLAGFFDGEGCIQIWKKKDSRTPLGYGICVTVKITNTNRQILEEYNKLCNGKFSQDKRNEKAKIVHGIYYSSYADILIMLSQILPFLRLKKRVADLMISFCTSRLNHIKSAYTEEELHLFSEIKVLIKRGI